MTLAISNRGRVKALMDTWIWLSLISLALLVLPNAGTHAQGLRCDRFDIKAQLSGSDLITSIDTDCPDFTSIIVRIHRTYQGSAVKDPLSQSYLEVRSTVAA